MASKPGILTDWPWKPLGDFKFVILTPWIAHSIYSFIWTQRDPTYHLIFPYIFIRMLHNQIWISISRYQTSKGKCKIVDKGIEFQQVDRETNWDDQILLTALLFYIGYMIFPMASNLPWWRTDGVVLTAILHAGPVEFLYYWLHRALHHHYLYSRYHSHHHSSIVTEPITFSVSSLENFTPLRLLLHQYPPLPFANQSQVHYFDIFNTQTTLFPRFANFEFFPKKLLSFFPKKLLSFFPLFKYLSYTPSFHSLHHTKFRTNYSLFMPIYDYIYGTVDKTTDATYEGCLKRPKESPDVVHLTHLTSFDSIYQLRLGFSSLASNPQTSKWYIHLMWPFTMFSMLITWIFGRAIVLESNTFNDLKLQSWLIPRIQTQYFSKKHSKTLNNLIENAIMEAELNGAKVVSLGLFNEKQLNAYYELYTKRFRELKIKVVDGSSLVAAIVLNNIPKGTNKVLIRGKFNKVTFAIANALCSKNIEVNVLYKDELEELEQKVTMSKGNLSLSPINTSKIWLVGDEWDEDEQMKAPEGTLFIPFSHFPPKKMREGCFYHYTPSMITPNTFMNSHSCENWLPRRVMSAWRIAGIIHALEGWNVDEYGDTILDTKKVWEATIRHGFQPLKIYAHKPCVTN